MRSVVAVAAPLFPAGTTTRRTCATTTRSPSPSAAVAAAVAEETTAAATISSTAVASRRLGGGVPSACGETTCSRTWTGVKAEAEQWGITTITTTSVGIARKPWSRRSWRSGRGGFPGRLARGDVAEGLV